MNHMCENFIFIYLGLTIFTREDNDFKWGLILLTFLFIMIARAASVFPLAKLINMSCAPAASLRASSTPGTLPKDAIPKSHQIMLVWAGLRGAVAFALSMDIQTENAGAVRTTTLIVVALSIVVLGGTITYVMKYVGLISAEVLLNVWEGGGCGSVKLFRTLHFRTPTYPPPAPTRQAAPFNLLGVQRLPPAVIGSSVLIWNTCNLSLQGNAGKGPSLVPVTAMC